MSDCKYVFLSMLVLLTPGLAFAQEGSQELSQTQRFERLENRLIAIERRVLGETSTGSGTMMADHEARLQTLEAESSKIYGTAEEVAHAVEKLAEKVEIIAQDLELRLQDIEAAISANAGAVMAEKKTLTAAQPQATKAAEAARPVPVSITADALYNQAYDFMKKASFPSAEHWFMAFIERHPEHAKAENAYYWLGEVRLVLQKPQEALVAFGDSIKKFPSGRRAADSLLKMGVAFEGIGKKELARTTWEKLVKDFPEASAAQSAKKRLENF